MNKHCCRNCIDLRYDKYHFCQWAIDNGLDKKVAIIEDIEESKCEMFEEGGLCVEKN